MCQQGFLSQRSHLSQTQRTRRNMCAYCTAMFAYLTQCESAAQAPHPTYFVLQKLQTASSNALQTVVVEREEREETGAGAEEEFMITLYMKLHIFIINQAA